MSVYLFTCPKKPPTWVNIKTQTIIQDKNGGRSRIKYKSISLFQDALDSLENEYGQLPIKLSN